MKVKNQIFLFSTMFFALNAFAQWSSVLNPTTSNTKGASVAVDKTGNIYVGGSVFKNSTEKENYYLVKYSPKGDTLWTRTYNRTNGSDQIVKVTVDLDNNVIVTGTSFGSTNAEDIVTLKYNPEGVVLNTYIFDGMNHLADKATDILVDNSGNYYICGTTRFTAYNGYALIKTNNQLVRKWAKSESPYYGSTTKKASFNAVCQKIAVTGYHTDWYNKYLMGTVVYDSAGVKIWNREYRSNDERSAVGFDVMLNNEGEAYVCGYETNAVTNKWEALLIKYNNSGDTIWTKKVSPGSSSLSVFKSMTHDNNGNIYVTGFRENTVITAKYSSTGAILWLKEHSGKLDFSTTDTHESIKLDNSGNVLVLARDYPVNGGGVMIIKYSSTGDYIWTKRYNGSPTQLDEPTTIDIDADNNIYTTVCSRNSNYYIDMATVKFTPNLFSGVVENPIKNRIDIYPNPSNGTFIFKDINAKTIVNVYSTDGAKIYQTELLPFEKSIQLEHLPVGVYFLEFQNNEMNYFTKIMIQN